MMRKNVEDGSDYYRDPHACLGMWNCPDTQVCQQNQCYFRMRDVHGLIPFWPGDNSAVVAKYGSPRVPDLRIGLCTNAAGISCRNRSTRAGARMNRRPFVFPQKTTWAEMNP